MYDNHSGILAHFLFKKLLGKLSVNTFLYVM